MIIRQSSFNKNPVVLDMPITSIGKVMHLMIPVNTT